MINDGVRDAVTASPQAYDDDELLLRVVGQHFPELIAERFPMVSRP